MSHRLSRARLCELLETWINGNRADALNAVCFTHPSNAVELFRLIMSEDRPDARDDAELFASMLADRGAIPLPDPRQFTGWNKFRDACVIETAADELAARARWEAHRSASKKWDRWVASTD